MKIFLNCYTKIIRLLYLTFACTPDKYHVCSEIDSNWKILQEIVIHTAEFKELECCTFDGKLTFDKKGHPLKRLMPGKQVNASYLVGFFNSILSEIIYHQNLLRLYRNISHLTCKVAHKCLNVREWVEVVEWNRKRSPPFPCCPVNCQCL